MSLSLYRSPELVRFVLGSVRLPEQATRVAISLDDPVRGPFLVVTRDGIFVTCLGLDMSPGELPVVKRGQLDAHLARLGDWRARAASAAQLSATLQGSGGLFARLFQAAEQLSREEMAAVTALQPLYEFDLFKLLIDAVMALDSTRETLLPILRKAPRLTGDTERLLRFYWKSTWMVGHLSVLAGVGGPRLLDMMSEGLRQEVVQSVTLSWGAVRQGIGALALRGAWLAGRIGKALVPAYKRALPEGTSPLTALNGTLALSAIALRHSRLRAEIEKALRSAGLAEHEGQEPTYLQTRARLAVEVLEAQAADPQSFESYHAAMGAAVVLRMTSRVPRGAPFAFEREEDVPRDLALTAATNAMNSVVDQPEVIGALFLALPWTARAAPEELYFPRDLLKATRQPWTPDATYHLLRPLAEMYRNPAPVKSGPARKEPCPCGSGRKYKRCCAVEA